MTGSSGTYPVAAPPGDAGALVREAREALQLMRKALKGERLYPVHHPIRNELVRNFVRSVSTVVRKWGTLSLRVSEKALVLQDQNVFDDEEGFELCRRIHSDGVREISLLQGIPEREVLELLLALSLALRSALTQDDFVTLLWERELSFVRLLISDEPVHEVTPEEQKRIEELSAAYENVNPDPAGKSQPQDHPLAEHLKEHFAREVSRDLSRNLSVRLGVILLTDLHAVPPADPYRKQVAEIFGDLLRSLVDAGELHGALTLAQEVERDVSLSPDEQRSFLAAFAVFRAPGWIEGYLESRPNKGPDPALAAFLLMLGSCAAAAVIKLLRDEDPAHLLPVAETLAQIDPGPFLEALAKGDAEDLRTMLGLLDRCEIEIPRAATEGLLHRSTAAIRVLAVRITSRSGDAGAGALLMPLLDDPDESVRIQAARSLCTLDGMEVFPRLALRVGDQGFHDRSLAERLATLESIARAGGRLAVNTIATLLREKRWFKNPRFEESQVAAAKALELIAGDEARAALESGAHAKSHAVKSACELALSRRA